MEERNGVEKRRNRHADTEKSGGKLVKAIIVIIVILLILVISTVLWYNISLSGTGTEQDKVSIEIPLGSGSSKIASILKENGLIRSEAAFKLYVKLNKITTFQAGNYNLTKNMKVPEIVEALQNGKVLKDVNVKMTFVEGKNFRYFAKVIAENTYNTEEDVYNLMEDEEYLDSLIKEYWFITDEIKDDKIYYPLEGYLAPNTYGFEEKDVTVEEIFKTLLDQTAKILEPYRKDIEKSKYSVHDILTVASITETEAIFDKDRKNVSSVIYNRLDKKMSIGSDVTTYYAFKIELGTRDLYKQEINTYNQYNTRGPNMAGKLPIGPIASVSKESIEAAINPNSTDYLFFVADKSGNIFFTKTNEEHQKAIDQIKNNGEWITFNKDEKKEGLQSE